MGQNQSDNLVDTLNKEQEEYYIKRKLHHLSRSPCFKGYKRIQADENEKSHKKIPHDKTRCYFLKIFPYDNEKEVKYFDREQKILELFLDEAEILKNEKTVTISIKDKKCILVPTIYYRLNDVFEYLWHMTELDEKLIRSISFQAVKILKLLKERQVVHNGIKFENFIVVSDSPVKISLTDFKLAQILNQNEKSNEFIGTSVYKAPEVLKKEGHDFSADMWSLGANIYLNFFRQFPFDIEQDDDETVILNKIEKNTLHNRNHLASDDAWECITKMLTLNPAERIGPEDAINLKWFDIELNPPTVAPDPNEIHINDGHEDEQKS